jgi:hypothetical protein
MAEQTGSRKRKEWEPKQVEVKEALDLRHASLGPRGYKVRPVKTGKSTYEKILRAQQQPEEQPMAMEHDGDDMEIAPAVKRQRAEGVAYRNVSADEQAPFTFYSCWSRPSAAVQAEIS